jgi:hypothetical protein
MLAALAAELRDPRKELLLRLAGPGPSCSLAPSGFSTTIKSSNAEAAENAEKGLNAECRRKNAE